jgi:hypothetical protein
MSANPHRCHSRRELLPAVIDYAMVSKKLKRMLDQ